MNSPDLHRRIFLKYGLAATAAGLIALKVTGERKTTGNKLPRWRGFNLLEKFDGNKNEPFRESDFKMIAAWGFDFVRLPMSYHCWSSPENWFQLNEKVLKEIDEAVEYGRRYKLHVNLNLHRIPGYCVNPPAEPLDLWKDEKAQEAAAFHWRQLAKRYKGISTERLSFDLINEPAKVEEADYIKVVKKLVAAIRSEDKKRIIIADGLQYGTRPVWGLKNEHLGQSTRGYGPFQLTHYKASWVNGSDSWPQPAWPINPDKQKGWNKESLVKETFEPWKKLMQEGVGVHVGEWGVFNQTPHHVALGWMRDNLQIWKENGWGWALWNFRGAFGVLDSGRKDVSYEDYQGHKLDRKMLDLLQAY